jgi:hypothetical protein
MIGTTSTIRSCQMVRASSIHSQLRVRNSASRRTSSILLVLFTLVTWSDAVAEMRYTAFTWPLPPAVGVGNEVRVGREARPAVLLPPQRSTQRSALKRVLVGAGVGVGVGCLFGYSVSDAGDHGRAMVAAATLFGLIGVAISTRLP